MKLKDAIECPQSEGRARMIKHLKGEERLTQKEAIQAFCFECMGGFKDGLVDCKVKDCPLYPFMQYNPNKIASIAPSIGQGRN